MAGAAHVLFKFASNPYGGLSIDVTSSSGRFRELSPFILGPVKAFGGEEAKNLENFWQFSKVYMCHVDAYGEPSLDWYEWRSRGFRSERAQRYPMGKGAVPLYSFWHGEHLNYIDARKRIYATFYAKLAGQTAAFAELRRLYDSGHVLVLRGYDAYNYVQLGMSLKDVINCETRKMDHAFVLAMMLTGELEECINS